MHIRVEPIRIKSFRSCKVQGLSCRPNKQQKCFALFWFGALRIDWSVNCRVSVDRGPGTFDVSGEVCLAQMFDGNIKKIQVAATTADVADCQGKSLGSTGRSCRTPELRSNTMGLRRSSGNHSVSISVRAEANCFHFSLSTCRVVWLPCSLVPFAMATAGLEDNLQFHVPEVFIELRFLEAVTVSMASLERNLQFLCQRS